MSHYTEIKSRLLTITYKQRPGWPGPSNLSLSALLFITFQTDLSSGSLPSSLGACALILILSFTKSLHDGLLFIQLSAQTTVPQIGLPRLPMAKAGSPNHSSHMFSLLFLQSLYQYEVNLFVYMLTIYLDPLEH